MSTLLIIAALSMSLDMPGQTLEDVNAAVQKTYDAVVGGDGRVDYRQLKNNKELTDNLQQYHEFVSNMDLDAIKDKNEKIAILSNTYNVFTLLGVTRAWPVESVRKISPLFGFFKRQKWDFAGKKMTLDDIENKHLRLLDNRIHFLINCASGSCPALVPVVLTADNLESVMEKSTTAFLKDETKNRFDKKTQTFHLSKIFKWFGDDWGNKEGVVAFVKKYRSDLDWDPKKVVFLDYDWSLNGPTQ